MATGNVTSLGSSRAEDDSQPKERSPTGWHSFWQKEHDAANKRMRKFQKQGNGVVKRFLDERLGGNDDFSSAGSSDIPFRLNLFHTNITTLLSMLYGSTPKVDVSREHHDPDDDVARVASLLFQRILQSDVEASGEDFPTAIRAALQDRLLPGLGVCRVRYDMSTTNVMALNPVTMDMEEQEQLEYEDAPVDYVHWQDFQWGWARTWSETPWCSFRAWLTKTEATTRFGEDIANGLEYKNQLPTGGDNKEENLETDQKNNVQKAEIWEFWRKEDRKVYWWSQGADIILDIQEDPLQLDGFWPIPKPMMANLTTTLLMPRADFIIAQDLYNEIDVLQSRISTITRAVKVVGVYDKSAEGVQRMLKEGVENDLIPVDNWAMFAEKGGIPGTVQWFPVQEIAQTLQILRGLLGETIELLYQVTGMSDILRGANTDQYTSDGTNQLKAKFGSIRVQALQDDFARFASDLEGLKAEVISKHFSPQTIAQQSAAQFMPQADLPAIPAALELMQSPDIKWRVDIRPESIAMVDYAQLKSERTEFLMGMAQYIQSAAPAIQAVPGSMPILLELMKWGMAGFKGAAYLEGSFDQAIDMAKKMPPDEGKGKEDKAKAEADMAKLQAQHKNDMEKIQAKAQADQQVFQAKMAGEMQKIQADSQAKMQQAMAKSQGDLRKIAEDMQADLTLIDAKLQAEMQGEMSQAEGAAAEMQVGHENTLTEMAVDHEFTLDEMSEDHENAKVEARQQNRENDTD